MAIGNLRRAVSIGSVLFALALIVVAPQAQEHAAPHWSYTGATGPDHWADLDKAFSACQTGHHQSPIDIRAPKPSDLPAIQFAYQTAPLHIVNNGHTIQLNYAAGSSITVGGKKYELTQFHFHHPSEEKINGKGFAMDAHLVHKAADGSLAVVAVLLEPGAANSVISAAWQHLANHEGPEQKFDSVRIDAAALLPADRGYYTFAGSLTTPPCTEGVTWLVLKTPQRISQGQLDVFAKIYPLNERPTQPLYDREVLASK